MFGYIKPLKQELKIKDYEAYRGVYCGLCKELGRTFGPFARLTLSYDFAFLSIVETAVSDEPACFERKGCFIHPFNKRLCCKSRSGMKMTSSAAMLMVFYKNEDNFADSGLLGKLSSLIIKPFVLSGKKKAAKLYPELDIIISDVMKNQKEIELQKCPSTDMAAEPTAKALGEICERFSSNEAQKKYLKRFGYLIGRWVYLIDALDDIEDDLKSGNYNPFILSNPDIKDESDISKIRENALLSLNLTLGEAARTYQELEIKSFMPVLENIIYMGLPAMQEYIKIPKRSRKNDRSL